MVNVSLINGKKSSDKLLMIACHKKKSLIILAHPGSDLLRSSDNFLS